MKDQNFQTQLAYITSISNYVAHIVEQKPEILNELIHSGDLQKKYQPNDFLTKLNSATDHCVDEEQFYKQLRLFRHREMLRIIWRDLLNIAETCEILLDLSNLADACLNITKNFYTQQQDPDNDPLFIIALGKLGGQELNFSSDIDLMFCSTNDDEKLCLRLAQQITRALNTITEDGFVFRVDLRLRPFGQSGPLTMNLQATEMYYQNHGRPWERYALLKARIINENHHAAKLKHIFKSFVYRSYVDYSVIDALRQMKQLIEQETNFSNATLDIKRGNGGIRQIEFIVQAIQLIRGGQDKQLQQSNLLATLSYLKTAKLMPAQSCDELQNAYLFLRKIENRLQMFDDKQTHLLPTTIHEQQKLAKTMGFSSWQQFDAALTQHRNKVAEHFEQMIKEPETTSEKDQILTQLTWVWDGNIDQALSNNILQTLGFESVDDVQQMIASLKNSQHCRVLTQEARTRLDKLMPLLLLETASTNNNVETLKRLLAIIDAIMRRSAYLVLLWENRNILHRLVQLCSGSSLIAEQIAAYPLLLDELLKTPRQQVLSSELLLDSLNTMLSSLPENSQEQQMEALRRFHHAEVLHIASAQTLKLLSENEISLSLTNLAQAILLKVYDIAVNDLQKKYGDITPDFAIIAYGKLGSFELSFGSDLDLVFLYQTPDKSSSQQNSNEFYLRLTQRILHLIQTKTVAGNLYTIDTRLRPSGSAGLLVSDIDAFAKYQQQQAWVWESQALVRARIVVASTSLQTRFDDIRRQLLMTPRNSDYLKQEIRSMRERMRAENDNKDPSLFDIKQGVGGMTDIEFIVQFLVLNFAKSCPTLVEFHDNIALVEECQKRQILSQKQAELLTDAYIYYRRFIHQSALQRQPAIFEAQLFETIRQNVVTIWNEFLGQ